MKYCSKGLRFTKEGYPEFAPHARQLPNGKNHVEIEYTGSRRADFAAANKKAKLDETPIGLDLAPRRGYEDDVPRPRATSTRL